MHPNESLREPLEWPYPIKYEQEREVRADVLVLGGGLAGCHAAINAARRGAKVAIVDKGAVIRSGSGGAGIDHWHDACTNPACQVTPEEMIESGGAHTKTAGEYWFGHAAYIACRESYDTLLDLEGMGMRFRDEGDEFAGAEFRDPETQIMYAYDYENKHTIRLSGGADMKLALYRELRRLGVDIYDRVMATGLLTKGGKPGDRVVGATGVHARTGEFLIFVAKATVMATCDATRLWVFSTELKGAAAAHLDPNNTGDGHAMAWQAGAEFTMMERSHPSPGGFSYPAYGVGNAHNTWFACTLVDSRGKEIPWVDRDGRVLEAISERYRPSPGQRFFVLNPGPSPYEVRHPYLIRDLRKRVMRGEYALPLWADLPGMPEHERRAIFGLMVGNEGKTRVPIYETYVLSGFDPDKDMLQVPGLGDRGSGPPQWREQRSGTLVVDWNLRTNLEGLYAAGHIGGTGGAAGSSTTGRYAGRKAAAYARGAADPTVDRDQIDAEKARVYAPIRQPKGIGYKEVHAGTARIMQDYCGEYKSRATLKAGLHWLGVIRESEAASASARNPHELVRTLECFSRITAGEMVMHASLARKASSRFLDFKRLDYPEIDPEAWNKFVTIRRVDGEVQVGEQSFDFWLKGANAATYQENYDRHSDLEQ
jgi:succinate dehydrogenase/fumarate reductase flavoprotein subunit